MKYFERSIEKNEILKLKRNISFEEIVLSIANGGLKEIKAHPNQKKYPGQMLFFVEFNNYIYTVPFMEDENKVFLKTIYPDRIATKLYLGETNE
jgi:hypothetical protein